MPGYSSRVARCRIHDEVSLRSTAELFRRTTRDPSQRRVGIEVERIGFWADGKALGYEGHSDRVGAAELLSELSVRYGWSLVDNGSGRPVGVASYCGKVSLEPGSQLELSSETASSLHSLVKCAKCFEKDVHEVAMPHGLRFVGIGVNPVASVEELDLIDLPRYRVMTDYLNHREALGTSMMRLTSSVQVNLDYTSEAEGIEMLRVALALTPISYALFANSPWHLGKRSEFLSYRGHIWRHTDPDRAGILDRAFDSDFSFSSYADHLWNLPLMFAQNEKGEFVAARGATLKSIQSGALPGVCANGVNEMHAVRQAFTEARLKPGYIEVRSIDGQRSAMRFAAAAFWMGVLYSPEARALSLNALGGLTPSARNELWDNALKQGLDAKIGRVSLVDIARDLTGVAMVALKARGLGEESLLLPLQENLIRGLNPAQILLERFGQNCPEDFSGLLEYLSES